MDKVSSHCENLYWLSNLTLCLSSTCFQKRPGTAGKEVSSRPSVRAPSAPSTVRRPTPGRPNNSARATSRLDAEQTTWRHQLATTLAERLSRATSRSDRTATADRVRRATTNEADVVCARRRVRDNFSNVCAKLFCSNVSECFHSLIIRFFVTMGFFMMRLDSVADGRTDLYYKIYCVTVCQFLTVSGFGYIGFNVRWREN